MRALQIAVWLLALGVANASAAPQARSRDWAAKVDPAVFSTFSREGSGETDFIVLLAEQADLSGAKELQSKNEKGAFVYQKLTEVAKRSQAGIVRMLTDRRAAFQPFWAANMIHVRGSLPLVQDIAFRAEVARIESNPVVHFDEPIAVQAKSPDSPTAIEPGVAVVKAPELWARGYTGQGVVVGGMDTGYRWSHLALKNQYRGWNGASADHNYNWHDAIHSGGGSCGANSLIPCDDGNHGTHTMGTAVGSDGAANQIGVAPGAQWIGCRCMDEGDGTPATYTECFQWFIAPTDLNGNNPDPTKAPDVINNSWSCPSQEGCAANTLRTVVENVRAAGIVVVVSAGNGGSGCSTVNTAPAIYDASFSIGATTTSDAIAGFSSRGPITLDGSGRLKPNVVAPGVNTRSAVPGAGNSSYGSLSGTSMAAPHVAGAIALLLSAHPELKGDVEGIETLLEQSALPLTSTQSCGGIPGTQIPNTTFGWGRIDALAAAGLDDPDGDGMLDWQELIAGTKRDDPLSVFRISEIVRQPTETLVYLPSVDGRNYELQGSDDLLAPNWTTVDTDRGDGQVIELIDTNPLRDLRVYRVLVVP